MGKPNPRNLTFDPTQHPHVCRDGITYLFPCSWCPTCQGIPYDTARREHDVMAYPAGDPTWECPGCRMGLTAGWLQDPWNNRGQVVHARGIACPYQVKLQDVPAGALVVYGRTLYVFSHVTEIGGPQRVAVLVDVHTRETEQLGLTAAVLVLMPEAPAVFAEMLHPARAITPAPVAVRRRAPRKEVAMNPKTQTVSADKLAALLAKQDKHIQAQAALLMTKDEKIAKLEAELAKYRSNEAEVASDILARAESLPEVA